MKNLLKLALISSIAVNLTAELPKNSPAQNSSQEDLVNECAKGNTEACKIIIDNDPALAEIRKELIEDEWIEQEKLGISLRLHYLAYQRGKEANANDARKNGKKFVKQVLRTEMYKK